MLIARKERNTLRALEFLTKLGSYVVGVALVCYLCGFVIANLYLGSLGVVNVDMLRTRYIQVGLLFLLFVGAIGLLTYGLLETLRSCRRQSPWRVLCTVVGVSLKRLAGLYLPVAVVGLLAGSVNSPPVGVPGVAATAPWSAWLLAGPRSALVRSVWVLPILPIALCIMLIIVVIANPKDRYGSRKPRKTVLAEAWCDIRSSIWRHLGALVGLFAFCFIWFAAGDLLVFMSSNKGMTSGPQPYPVLTGDWGRFFAGVAIIYVLAATALTAFFLVQTPNDRDDEPESTADMAAAWVYIVAAAIALVVPVYSLGVYPSLPQQLGGGRVVQVSVGVASEDVKRELALVGNDVYLVDRAPASALFLVVDKQTRKYKVIEVAASTIESITFAPSP